MLIVGKTLIFDRGSKDTWSRDSIIGPPMVPVAQDTDKRDLKLNFASITWREDRRGKPAGPTSPLSNTLQTVSIKIFL